MSDRVILAVKFTPAGASSAVRNAVSGFLRYVQHRDLHPTQPEGRPRSEVSSLLKYVAYRDRASTRAELFGRSGTLTSEDRKAFAGFVAKAVDESSPQLFRGREGRLHDRRRAVYRLVISPERASGLDLRRLTAAAASSLERESGISGLQWIAAIHRNTAHHHVHLVVAGIHQGADGAYRRVDLTKQRLAAMKEALAHEIEYQRAERVPNPASLPAAEAAAADRVAHRSFAPTQIHLVRIQQPQRARREGLVSHYGSVIALRAVARRYQRRMQRELEENYRQSLWEHAA